MEAVAPFYADDLVTLHHGDCLDVMATMPDASVHAVVTDPPYGLEFMGKGWDSFGDARQPFRGEIQTPDNPFGRSTVRFAGTGSYGAKASAMVAFQAWCEQWAAECLRVLKPGGHLLAFGGTRTWHRLAVAIEDAGFEIRDSMAWLYGSGFPKSLDVSKAITATQALGGSSRTQNRRAMTGDESRSTSIGSGPQTATTTATTQAPERANLTPDASRWQGWGTALKPAFEPIVVARKPLAGTVAQTVLAHGTGALNVDGCRVEGEVPVTVQGGGGALSRATQAAHGYRPDGPKYRGEREREGGVLSQPHAAGRWPPNVVLDDTAAAELDRQSGELTSGTRKPGTYSGLGYMGSESADFPAVEGSTGGASRFFPTFKYEAKAPTEERPTYTKPGAGTGRVTGLGGKVRQCNVCETRAIGSGNLTLNCGHDDYRWEEPTAERSDKVAHPTVKPLNLMRWLVRLVTPPGGTILDPFAGSGTTAEAAIIEGFRCVTIEREADYLPLILARLTKPIEPVLDLGALA